MKKRNTLFSIILTFTFIMTSQTSKAQDWFQMHVNYGNHTWAFPYAIKDFSYFDFDTDDSLLGHLAVDSTVTVPFTTNSTESWAANIDSITFSDDLTSWNKNKYKVFAINITTTDGVEITSKEEYVPCYVSIDGMGEYPDNSRSARIRGRGNSTWKWYDKKPYRIKFNVSSKVLGVAKNKDWVLLANYRDVTDMMNVFAFVTSKWMGLPFTSPVRFAEVFLNGKYNGIYQIAEQVEVGGNRVDIDEDEGLLFAIDLDDGPGLSPDETNNFYSEVYSLPIAMKWPKNPSEEKLEEIKSDLAVLERAIQNHDYDALDSLMDIPSYIAMDQIQEYLYNVELAAPRSVFMFKDKGGKYTMGPSWDWDAGYDFSWSDMYTGHTFFKSYKETLFGNNPYKQNGDYKVPGFFTDMFASQRFVEEYKARWNEMGDSLFLRNWEETQKYIDGLNETQVIEGSGGTATTSPQQRETERWPISGKDSSTETQKMKTWLKNRYDYITELINSYPIPVETNDTLFMGTISRDIEMDIAKGYSQNVNIEVSKDELATLLQVDEITDSQLDLVPLNADGSVGNNTAAGTYGAWFDEDGNTADYNYGDVHVYIESNDLYTWNCGCHPYNCESDDEHTVTMQYRYVDGKTLKTANVVVNFSITGEGGWWWW